MTIIQLCSCKHEGQDNLHGKGNRVKNSLANAGKDSGPKYRCTVCGTVK